MTETSRILIVDDEAPVLRSVSRALRGESFDVETATSPVEALDLIRRHEYAVVLSDYRMPEMSGTALLSRVRNISPDSVRVMLTAHADTETMQQAVNVGEVFRFLAKPWEETLLRTTMRQAVEQHLLQHENRRLGELIEEQNRRLRRLNEDLEDRVSSRTEQIASLNEQMRDSFVGSIKAMASLGDAHSQMVGSHSRRVATLVRELTGRFGLEDEGFQVCAAAVLHDIGKVVPDADPERPEHAIRGEEILSRVPGLEVAAKLVRHHHERLDGKGFPDGLRRDDIPLGSRIIAVVSAYDNSMNAEDGLEEAEPIDVLQCLSEETDTRYDARVLHELRVLLGETGRLHRERVELELSLSDLRPGMVLVREIRTVSGRLLVGAGACVTEDMVSRLRRFQSTDPVVEMVHVVRNRSKGIGS